MLNILGPQSAFLPLSKVAGFPYHHLRIVPADFASPRTDSGSSTHNLDPPSRHRGSKPAAKFASALRTSRPCCRCIRDARHGHCTRPSVPAMRSISNPIGQSSRPHPGTGALVEKISPKTPNSGNENTVVSGNCPLKGVACLQKRERLKCYRTSGIF